MNWYYAPNNEQMGPVDPATLDRLVREGVVTPETPVWHEGMAGWLPYAEAMRPANAPPPVGVLCAECGRTFPPDEVVRLGAGHVCAGCKPIALQKLQEGVLGVGGSEQVRRDHIKHEASVRSVGILYWLGAIGLLAIGIGFLFTDAATGRRALIATTIITTVLGFGFIWLGWAVRQLRPWARIASGIVAGLGLINFPFGTLINGYILWLLFSKKGKTVFSEDYKRVIAETPHINYRTSVLVLVFAVFVVILLLVAIVGGVMSRP